MEILLLYKRLKKIIKSLYNWLKAISDQCSHKAWLTPDDSWENIEWKETIENELIEAKKLLVKYNSIRVSKHELPLIPIPSFNRSYEYSIDKMVSIILKVARSLEDAYNALSMYIEPQLSETEKQQINSLRSELEEMEREGYDYFLIKNLKEAVKEIENNHYLASSLIAARVVLYCIDKIEGKDEEEKAKFLIKQGIIPKREKSKETIKWFIKAVKAARNSISHKITNFPQASESFSILGDSFKMVRIFHKYNENKK